MRNYLDYVVQLEKTLREAESVPLTATLDSAAPAAATSDKAPILILSPHPDDEMLVGALPLRFLKQCGIRVINLSITLGSKRERQASRWLELKAACDSIGFEVRTFGERGLEKITPEAREASPEWQASAIRLADAIAEIKPSAIFYPHASDANRTHKGVHLLALDALTLSRHPCMAFETEFWSPNVQPNLCVEVSKEDLAELITALARHEGEVARNPYHLRLPAWMMDNVRRGGELVGAQGGAVPGYLFATLYRRQYWDGRQFTPVQAYGLFLGREENPLPLLSCL
jgi:LmbE family N-acetylglucosaminyl deacetylase